MINEKNNALLQLFGEEGASGDMSAAGTDTGENQAGNESFAAGKTEDLDAEFSALVAKGGKYASAFQAQMQKAFNKRFASFKEREASVQRLESLREAVANKYSNVDSTDIEALKAAIANDAVAKGDDADKHAARVMFNVAMRNIAQNFYSTLCREEREMREKYKGFDLNNEICNPKFRKMIVEDGNSLEDAYWHVHREELLTKLLAEARSAAFSVTTRRARPVEGAASANIPSTSKVDYKNMSDSEFMALYNRTVRR